MSDDQENEDWVEITLTLHREFWQDVCDDILHIQRMWEDKGYRSHLSLPELRDWILRELRAKEKAKIDKTALPR